MTAPPTFPRLRDEPFEVSPGTTLRMFSVEHLLWQNLCAAEPTQDLVARLETLVRGAPDWDAAWMARAAAARLRERLCLGPLPADLPATAEPPPAYALWGEPLLVAALIHKGHGLGLAAPWGVAPEAALFWAAAAALLTLAGFAHPAEYPAARRTATPLPSDGDTPCLP